LIVGHGELEQELRKKVEDLGLQKVVLFIGGIVNKELPPYYASADIFIGPSIQTVNGDSEGFGLTFVEAAMSGCLLIGTKNGGIEDIIDDGQTGFLVPPANVRTLAEAILFAVDNLNHLQDMRMKSKQKVVEKFDWEIISRKYVNAYSLHL